MSGPEPVEDLLDEPDLEEELPPALDGERLDRVLSMLGEVSRARAGELVDAGVVTLDDRVVTQRSRRVRAGERIAVHETLELPDRVPLADPDVAVSVVHEDAHLLVIDKPPGLVVHPGAGNPTGTLVNGLLAIDPTIAGVGDPARPGIVHRLDKGTSGLLIVARTAAAYEGLVAMLSAREIDRRYTALAWGEPASTHGMVDAPIGRSQRDPTRMAVVHDGREARTGYEVVRVYSSPVTVSLLTCRLYTGRTHQIRVHLAAIGHAVVGDERYGGARSGLVVGRPFLHAAALSFRHPVTGAMLELASPLPPDLAAVLDTLS
jgi:23S rRNA pseudouridine1911/1915/1917 synthase